MLKQAHVPRIKPLKNVFLKKKCNVEFNLLAFWFLTTKLYIVYSLTFGNQMSKGRYWLVCVMRPLIGSMDPFIAPRHHTCLCASLVVLLVFCAKFLHLCS